ncbi:protein WFDC10B [Dipodomys spectabilis]|uniref:protein WFDC10B n=1 Tax=Dipodomys spectabilis TaxID=105255 RepID=UPI001C542136|nr:protein WFDC10B [Dipodomys spectabilis]
MLSRQRAPSPNSHPFSETQTTSSETQEPSSGIKRCEKRTSIYLCKYPCEVQEDCEASNVCCSTFCGNVCINTL